MMTEKYCNQAEKEAKVIFENLFLDKVSLYKNCAEIKNLFKAAEGDALKKFDNIAQGD